MSSSKLLEFLNCEQLDRDIFRGESKDFRSGQVYGGQVFGQAVRAAMQTVQEGRHIRSAHAYFLRRGDVNTPIIYRVQRSLDGSRVSSRRVEAIQNGLEIFILSASFHDPEDGLDYAEKADLPIDLLSEDTDALMENFSDHALSQYADFFILNEEQRTNPLSLQMWIKAKHKLPNDYDANCAVLSFISDMVPMPSTVLPHFKKYTTFLEYRDKIIMSSIDHTIWFHRPLCADDWFFYDCKVQSTSGARGLSFGKVYQQDGTLVASISQEGLLRTQD